MIGSRVEMLNNWVLLIVLTFALKLNKLLPGIQDSPWHIPLSLLATTGVYIFMIRAMRFAVARNEFLLRIYWGKLYLNGYWSYEYSRNGHIFYGFWRIEQDIDSIKIIGSGLGNEFTPRTVVRSVSPLIEDQGAYWVLNVRTELINNDGPISPVYSKTTLILDRRKGFNQVITMRATTEIFGGTSSGHVHPDVIFKKHLKANSDDDVITELKKRYK